jgi:hypothetical protein
MPTSSPTPRRATSPRRVNLEPYPIAFQTDPLPAGIGAQDGFAAFRERAMARFSSNSIEFQRGIPRTGLTVACLTRLGFPGELASGELVWVPLASSELSALEIGVFIPPRPTLTPAASLVVTTLTRQSRQLAAAA